MELGTNLIRLDYTVLQGHNPPCLVYHPLVVCRKDEGHAFFLVHPGHHIEQVGRRCRIQVGGGFIGPDELGVGSARITATRCC